MRPGKRRFHLSSGPVLFALLLCCLLPLAEAASPVQTSADTLARRVDAYYNGLRSLQCDFAENYNGMGIHREERGTLLLRKPGKMRWTYRNPPGKIFILNGRYGWFYSPGDAQAQRLQTSQMDDMRSPLRFLLGHTRIEKEFANLTLSNTAGGLELSGVPKGMEKRVSNVTLGVTAEGMIQSIRITEIDGSRTSYEFTGMQPNIPVPESEFIFQPPAGVPVVDGLPPV